MTPQPDSGRVHVIRDPAQLRAFRTPTRHRVLNAVLELGPCSVGEIADRLQWKAESIYYHVKALNEVGLVRRVGERSAGRKPEALYEAVAPEIVVDQEDRTPAYLAAVWDVYRASLRACERDLERALFDEEDGEGPRRNTLLHQVNVRLSRRKAEQLRAMVDDVVRFAMDNEYHDGPESISLTVVVSRIPRS